MKLNTKYESVAVQNERFPKQIFKLLFFLLLAFSFFSATASSSGQTVSLNEKNATLESIFKKIKIQTGYSFVFTGNSIKNAKKVSIKIINLKIEEALKECLKNQPLLFTIYNNTIIIKDKGSQTSTDIKNEIPKKAFVDFTNTFIVIKGKVVNEKNVPLYGANVIEKGTNNTTTSDFDGSFSIKVVNPNATLVITFIGYSKKEVPLNGNTIVNAILYPIDNILTEVVITGYGTQKKRDLTGAISSITSKEIRNLPVPNIQQALQGRLAGVYISNNTGKPGSTPIVRIRGFGTFGDNNPLYVVDGQPIDDINSINTNDVDRIEVLKDASSTAIFGSRGAAGVILITTKRGLVGKPAFNIDYNSGYSQITNSIKMLSSDQFYDFLNEASLNSGTLIDPKITKNYKRGYNTNWLNEASRVGVMQNFNTSLRGGNEGYKYSVQAGYFNELGVIKTTDFSRASLRLTNDLILSKNVNLGSTISLAQTIEAPENVSVGSIISADPFSPVYNDEADPFDPDYEFNKYAPTQYSFVENPVAVQARSFQKNKIWYLSGNIFLDFKLANGLYYKSFLGFDKIDKNESIFKPTFKLQYDDFNLSSNADAAQRLVSNLTEINYQALNYSWQNTIRYAAKIKQSSFDALVGITVDERDNRIVYASAGGIPRNTTNFQQFDNATNSYITRGGLSSEGLYSFLGRVNYNYDDRYLLTASYRADGSSKFGPDNKWGYFPSFSIGWNIANEPIVKNLKLSFIDLFKVRVGYGEVGNNRINGNYNFLDLVGTDFKYTYGFGGVVNQAYGVTSFGNKNLRWETSKQTNIGLDAAFFNNQLTTSIDYYEKKTDGLLLQVPLTLLTGYPNTPYSNAGGMINKGLELSLSLKRKIGSFNFEIGGNISTNINKVLSIGSGNEPIFGSVSKTVVGGSIGRFYGYVFDGLFQNQQQINNYSLVNSSGIKKLIQPNAQPGDLKFKDLNDDGVLNDDDRTFIGNPIPKFTYGFNINLEYKGIDLTAFFQGVQGVDVWSSYYTAFSPGLRNGVEEYYNGAWRGEGTSNFYPRISYLNANNNNRASSWWVQDGSFLRFQNLQIGYKIPSKILEKLKISNLRIFISGQNLYTFTKYSGADPEFGSQNPINNGVPNDVASYPKPRIISTGLNLKF